MNFGQIIYQISKALIDFGTKFKDVLTYNVNVSDLKKVFDFLGVNVSVIPDNVSILTLIGLFGTATILIIFVYKLFK